jgi:hypothetical protein
MMGGPGGAPGMGLIPSMGPGGMGPTTPMTPPPATPGAPEAKGAIKIKPRYEFVVVFTWKEPTPSDKLRAIKIAEPPAAGGLGGGMPAMAPSGPAPSGPAPKSGGEGEGGSLNIRGGAGID